MRAGAAGVSAQALRPRCRAHGVGRGATLQFREQPHPRCAPKGRRRRKGGQGSAGWGLPHVWEGRAWGLPEGRSAPALAAQRAPALPAQLGAARSRRRKSRPAA